VKSDAHVEFRATVFADNFTEPIILAADLTLNSRVKKTPLAQLVPDLDSLKNPYTYTAALDPGWVKKL
jgi:hypothetical protein